MPNRVIKDSIWSSPSLAGLEPYYQDQWVRWILMADDWGCFNADPDIIKGICYPKRKETTRQILKIRKLFNEVGKLFVWTDENGRTWGFFPSWDKHQFCNALGVDETGNYTKHRRKTPEPPPDKLRDYLSQFDKVQQDSTEFANPIPIPNPNPNPIDAASGKKIAKPSSWKDNVNKDLQDLIDYAKAQAFGLQGSRKMNRINAYNLMRMKDADGVPFGSEKVKQLVDTAVACRGERYAPQINDFIALAKKWADLLAFVDKQQSGGRIG